MNNQLVRNLRDQVQNLTNERNGYRRELRQETNRNRILRQQLVDLQRQNDGLQHDKDNLNQDIADLNRIVNNQKPRVPKKLWDQVGQQTRRKRKADYQSLFDDTLNKIPECKKAKVELRLGFNDVKFKWNLIQMQGIRDTLRNQGLRFRDPVIQPEDESDGSDNDDLDKARKKRRTVVSLMDKFQLSQRGYHEMRYLLTKSAPPINRIRQERVIMSCQIPYIKHPDVSK